MQDRQKNDSKESKRNKSDSKERKNDLKETSGDQRVTPRKGRVIGNDSTEREARGNARQTERQAEE